MLDGHPRADLNNTRYLVTRVHHQARKSAGELQAGLLDQRCIYSNRLGCIPASVPFRPLRAPRKPNVQGVQTAVVVGPSGEEIYTDKHGRIKVQMHWDRAGKRDEKSSCWVRVAQAWTGQGWGVMLIPRVGQEVVVDFVDGDPDRPLVTGCVYNALNVPPYALPEHKTRSTVRSASTPGGGGSNELRLEDRKGSEEVYVHAQNYLNVVVENDRTVTVRASQTTDVGSSRSATVGAGDDLSVTGSRTVSVSGGSHSVNVQGGSASISASGPVSAQGLAGVNISGGIPGVTINGAPLVAVQSAGSISLTAPNLAQQAATAIALTTPVVTIITGDVTYKIDASGMSANGKAFVTIDPVTRLPKVVMG